MATSSGGGSSHPDDRTGPGSAARTGCGAPDFAALPDAHHQVVLGACGGDGAGEPCPAPPLPPLSLPPAPAPPPPLTSYVTATPALTFTVCGPISLVSSRSPSDAAAAGEAKLSNTIGAAHAALVAPATRAPHLRASRRLTADS